jgi:hypothetical protein
MRGAWCIRHFCGHFLGNFVDTVPNNHSVGTSWAQLVVLGTLWALVGHTFGTLWAHCGHFVPKVRISGHSLGTLSKIRTTIKLLGTVWAHPMVYMGCMGTGWAHDGHKVKYLDHKYDPNV